MHASRAVHVSCIAAMPAVLEFLSAMAFIFILIVKVLGNLQDGVADQLKASWTDEHSPGVMGTRKTTNV
jgi:hypothetical protein